MRIWRAAAIVILAAASMVAADGAWAQAPTADMDKPGAHLVLALERADVRASWLGSMREEARTLLREARIVISGLAVEGDAVHVRVHKPEDADGALKALADLAPATPSGIGERPPGSARSDIALAKNEGSIISIAPTEEGLARRTGSALDHALQIAVRRLDGMRIAAGVVRQGWDRIHVHAPALQDTAALKELLTRPAQLDFHEAHLTASLPEAYRGRVPIGLKPYSTPLGELRLREIPVVRGSDITDAQLAYDATGAPVVNFDLNEVGARAFGKFTSENIGRRLALVLDDVVLSAPVIRAPILSGKGQVGGNFTVEDASRLAVQLRAGALPAKLTVVEERVVPSGR